MALIFCVSILLATAPGSGEAPGLARLDAARLKLKLEQGELFAEYGKALDKLIAESQKKGDLAGVNALTAQKAEVAKGLPPAAASTPSQKRMFAKAGRQLGVVMKARSEVLEEYQKAIKALTMAGKTKEANALDAELRAIRLDVLSLPVRVNSLRQGVQSEGVPWVVDGDELFSNPQAIDQMGRVWFGDPEWSEYDFSYEIRLDNQRGHTNSHFHLRDKDHLRALEIGGFNNMAKDLFSVINGKWERGNGDAFIRPGVELGKWQQFTVKVRGTRVTVIFNGREIIGNLEKQDFKKGMLGFSYHAGATARVRNVVVKTPDGLFLWQGVRGLGVER